MAAAGSSGNGGATGAGGGGGAHSSQQQKEKKLGHRRVRGDGEVTYKKFETTQLMGSIQLGLQQSVGSLAGMPERDLLMKDFIPIETVSFTRDGTLQKTPAHNYSEFRYRTFAPIAFKDFRKIFKILESDFLASLCSTPMIELSNPGASGSIFYLTQDDKFICKTVMHKEASFLRELLPGYYLNLKQNPRTLLPKFFGFYCYSCNAKNVRIVVMNNLLPSGLKMHHRFDLKGSTYKRKASRRERAKASPTYKDLDFLDIYPEGILLQPELHDNLLSSITRDCRVLESFRIMDYSLLIGIHNLDQASKEAVETVSSHLSVGDHDSSAVGGEASTAAAATSAAAAATSAGLERQGSFLLRERTIAHSTALESITMDVESSDHSLDGGDADVDASSSAQPPDITDSTVKNVWGGIPAKNHRGENLLLFIGIIDILQAYSVLKKAEHYWKSLIHDGDTVSVHRPSFYAKRFQNFMREKVFRRQQPPPQPPGHGHGHGQSGATLRGHNLSFRRSHFRRTLSRDDAVVAPSGGGGGGEADPGAPSRGIKDPCAVTVITIGDEVHLPSILHDRKSKSPAASATPPQNRKSNPENCEDVADVTSTSTAHGHKASIDSAGDRAGPGGGGGGDTGSIITMTSDERVQIFVPSPQTTPYNTITKGSQQPRPVGLLHQHDVGGGGGGPRLSWARDDVTPPPFGQGQLPSPYRSVTPLNNDPAAADNQAGLSSSSSSVRISSFSSSTTTANNGSYREEVLRSVTEETSIPAQTNRVITNGSHVTSTGANSSSSLSFSHATQETSLEMVKISIKSSSASASGSGSDGATPVNTEVSLKTLADDLPSLPPHDFDPNRQPVSLSDIQLEEEQEAGAASASAQQ